MKKVIIDAAGKYYKDLNREIKQTLADPEVKNLQLLNVCGQRYIGTGVKSDAVIEIQGIPGNDLGCFMSGPTLRVKNLAQDGVANTMNKGKIVVNGYTGDALAFGMRNGKVFVKGNVGFRACINMKEYEEMVPKVVIGGGTGDFAAEYMAGGVMIVLGLGIEDKKQVVGNYFGVGMHGGVTYVRGEINPDNMGKEVKVFEPEDEDLAVIRELVSEFCQEFPEYSVEEIMAEPFVKVIPVSRRPYGRLYSYGNTPLDAVNYGDYIILEG